MFGEKVCDGEDVAIGFRPDGTQKIFALGEDQKTVYIEGGKPIPLPQQFFERCNRGAEGIAVRWGKEGWDLVIVSEGGYPEGSVCGAYGFHPMAAARQCSGVS